MNKNAKQQVVNRLRRIEGQIRGLEKMVEREEYCVDVINQSLAVKEALSGVENLLLEKHLSTHVVEQMKKGDSQRATREIMRIYKVSRKK